MLPLVIAFSFHLPASGQSTDPWFAPDKVKHFFMSTFVQSGSYGALRTTGIRSGPALVGASATTLAVGIGKEIWDRHSHGDVSGKDVAWDVAGGVAAGIVLSRTTR